MTIVHIHMGTDNLHLILEPMLSKVTLLEILCWNYEHIYSSTWKKSAHTLFRSQHQSNIRHDLVNLCPRVP